MINQWKNEAMRSRCKDQRVEINEYEELQQKKQRDKYVFWRKRTRTINL